MDAGESRFAQGCVPWPQFGAVLMEDCTAPKDADVEESWRILRALLRLFLFRFARHDILQSLLMKSFRWLGGADVLRPISGLLLVQVASPESLRMERPSSSDFDGHTFQRSQCVELFS